MKLKEIKAVVEKELITFDSYFKSTVKSSAPLLNIIMNYIIRTKGKQIRPLFTFLSAGLNGGITEKTYRGAAMIELLHTATLVHDDVVDDSIQRRGFFSINAIWKNKIAVLAGDYLLSRGLLVAVNHGDFDLLKVTSDAVRQMSEGELLQIEKARTLDIKEEIYFEIIRMKTAVLIEACCVIGALSSADRESKPEQMREFGKYTGIAFQIKDDILDYDSSITGKPKGTDLKEKKLTLPLIYAMNIAPFTEKKHIKKLISGNSFSEQDFKNVKNFINEYGGFDYAVKRMQEYKNKAIDAIDEFQDSDYKSALIRLVEYVITRDK